MKIIKALFLVSALASMSHAIVYKSITFGAQSSHFADCGTTASIDGVAHQSVSIWFKHPNSPFSQSTDGILEGNINYATGHGGSGVLVYGTDSAHPGKVSAEMFTPTASAFYRVTGNTTNILDNAWHNIIVTYDSVAGYVVYIDGVNEALTVENTPLGTTYASGLSFGIGDNLNQGNTADGGPIALVQLWNITLSQANATAIAAGGLNTASPVFSWPFSEGTGTTTTDTVASKVCTFTGTFAWNTDIPASFPQLTSSGGGSKFKKFNLINGL